MQAWRTYLLVAVNLLAAVVAGAQEIDKAQLDAIVRRENRSNLPGFAVRILKGDELLYASGTGMANVHKQIPMGQTSVTNIGSVTKQFTAYAIFLLEERGKLKLSDEIHIYIPELADFGTPITLEQLMAHTSGLRDYPTFLSISSESTNRRLKLEEMIAFLQTHRELNFAPGSRFCYSNTGYMLLAKVVERVSGMSYAAFLKQEIFTPLGMSASFVNEGILLEQTDGTRAYMLNSKKTKAYTSRAHRDALGATGIYSNLEDLAKWNAFLYRHESGMFPKAAIAKMETSFRLDDGSSCNYGGGLILKKYRGKPVVEHSGGWGEYLTQCRRFPENGITILVVTNSQLDSPFELCDKLSNALLDFDDDTRPSTADKTIGPFFAELSGTYLSEDNLVRHVNVQMPARSVQIYPVARTSYSTYCIAEDVVALASLSLKWQLVDSVGNELSFLRDHDHSDSIQLHWTAGAYFHVPRTYEKLPPPRPETAAKNHCGRFYSLEADKTIRIRSRKNRLEYRPHPFIKHPMKQLGEGVYLVEEENYVIRFTEKGLIFGNDWVYNLAFERH